MQETLHCGLHRQIARRSLARLFDMIITNDLYWDCDCEDDYIHHKLKGNHCPRCDAYEHERPDSHENELYQYRPENDCAVRICPAVKDIYGGPGPRLRRMLEAKARLTPQQLDIESQAWEEAAVEAHFQDLEEHFRSEAGR